MFTDIYISKLRLHNIFLSKSGTVNQFTIEFVPRSFVDPSFANTITARTRRLILKQFAIHTQGHILRHSQFPGWCTNEMLRFSNPPSAPNHSPPPCIPFGKGRTHRRFSEVGLVSSSFENQALLFTTSLKSTNLLIFAGRNCTFISKVASSPFSDIISDFGSS